MKITRNAAAPSRPGVVPDNFTGAVRIDNHAEGEEPSRVSTSAVPFAPGARTVRHTHPAGQTIIIITGKGWIQRDGGPLEEVNPGDTVFFAVGEKHWRGASAETGMAHIAVTEKIDGKNVNWLAPVSDDQYRR